MLRFKIGENWDAAEMKFLRHGVTVRYKIRNEDFSTLFRKRERN